MNIDQEFFSIVEQLGAMGHSTLASYEPHPAAGTYARSAGSCGCGQREESAACCSSADGQRGVTFETRFPGLTPAVEGRPSPIASTRSWSTGPADQRITPFPKWDPGTRAWWVWDESRGSWTRAA